MPSVERTVTVLQPIEKVWAYLADFRTSQEWDPPSVSTTRTSGEGGVGTTYHNVSRIAGRETEVDYIVTEYVEHERFQLKGDAGSIQLLDTLTFSSTGEATSVTYRADFEPTGVAKLAEPLLPAALALLANKVAGSLEEHLLVL